MSPIFGKHHIRYILNESMRMSEDHYSPIKCNSNASTFSSAFIFQKTFTFTKDCVPFYSILSTGDAFSFNCVSLAKIFVLIQPKD